MFNCNQGQLTAIATFISPFCVTKALGLKSTPCQTFIFWVGGLKLPPDPPAGFAPAWECTSPDPEPSGRLRPQWGNGGSAPAFPLGAQAPDSPYDSNPPFHMPGYRAGNCVVYTEATCSVCWR